MQYLQKVDKLQDQQISELSELTEKLVRANLHKILFPHLKGRRVRFIDAMGICSVDIEHRRGGNYVVAVNDVWYSPPANLYGYTALCNPKCPDWIKDIQRLIQEYDELTRNQFAIEFKLTF